MNKSFYFGPKQADGFKRWCLDFGYLGMYFFDRKLMFGKWFYIPGRLYKWSHPKVVSTDKPSSYTVNTSL